MGISAGRLNRRVQIMRPTVALDRGEPTNTGWSLVATVWAEVIGQNGREAVIGHVLEGNSVYRITMRWRADLLPSDQVRLANGTDLNISAPPYDPDGAREQLILFATTDGAQKTS